MTASAATPAGIDLAVETRGGHAWRLLGRTPAQASRSLLWLPALGVAARHYLPFADALAARGVAVFLHEWRGHGSSNLRAGRACDWGYRELLLDDLPASRRALASRLPGVPCIVGGHSLGGQLAGCYLALDGAGADALWLVASGAPYWRAFPARTRWWLPAAYRFLPWLSDRRGALPGRTVGFGGNEARRLIRDWSRSGLSGAYAADGLDADLERALAAIAPDVDAVRFDDDWLGPGSSLDFLLAKFGTPGSRIRVSRLGHRALGVPADHFAWMKAPDAVAAALVGPRGDRA